MPFAKKHRIFLLVFGLCGVALAFLRVWHELPEVPVLTVPVNAAVGERLRKLGVDRVAIDTGGMRKTEAQITIGVQTVDLDRDCGEHCMELYDITDRYVLERKGDGYIVRAQITGKAKQSADAVARTIVKQVNALLDEYTTNEATKATWKTT